MDYIAELLKNITPEFSRHDIYFILFVLIFLWVKKERQKRKELESKVKEYEKILSKAKEKLWGGIDEMRMEVNGTIGNLRTVTTELIQKFSDNMASVFDKHEGMLEDIAEKVNENDKKDVRRDEAIDNLKEDVREMRRKNG